LTSANAGEFFRIKRNGIELSKGRESEGGIHLSAGK
jgi:hypothetical protein